MIKKEPPYIKDIYDGSLHNIAGGNLQYYNVATSVYAFIIFYSMMKVEYKG